MNKIVEKEMTKVKKDVEYVGKEIKKGVEFMGHEIKENTELVSTRQVYGMLSKMPNMPAMT